MPSLMHRICIVLMMVMIAGCAKANSSVKGSPVASPSAQVQATAAPTPEPTHKDPFAFSPDDWAGPVPNGAIARIGKGIIKSVSISPDGKRIAVASGIEVNSYDRQSLTLQWSFVPNRPIELADYSPKGDYIAVSLDSWRNLLGKSGNGSSTLSDQMVQSEIDLIKPEDGSIIQKLSGDWRQLFKMTISTDGKNIAFLLWNDSNIYIWNLDQNKIVETLAEPGKGRPETIKYSPDGTILAAGFDDNKILLWNANTYQVEKTLSGQNNGVYVLAFSPDGKSLVSNAEDSSLWMWELASGNVVWKQDGIADGTGDLGFSPDGKILMATAIGKVPSLLFASDGNLQSQIGNGDYYYIDKLAFAPSGDMVFFANSTLVFEYDFVAGAFRGSIHGYGEFVNDLALSPDEKTLAFSNPFLTFWDTNTFAMIAPLADETIDRADAIAYSPTGDWTAEATSYLEEVHLTSTKTYSLFPLKLQGHSKGVNAVQFSPDGKILASGSCDNSIILWDATNWPAQLQTLNGHDHCVDQLAFSPDGKILASKSTDGIVILWDMQSYAKIKRLSLPGGGGALAWSGDNQFIYVYDQNDSLQTWSIPSGKQIGSYHTQKCSNSNMPLRQDYIVVLPDGRVALGCAWDDIDFWNPKDQTETALVGHMGFVTALALGKDGKTLYSGSFDGTVVVWKIPS